MTRAPAATVSRWSVEPVRGRGRPVEGRLGLMAPPLARWYVRRILALPVGSRLRRLGLTRLSCQGWAANTRLDYDLLFSFYAPDVEMNFWTTPQSFGLGFGRRYLGVPAQRQLLAEWKAAFGEFRFDPLELGDAGGPRFACLVDQVARGRESGVEVSQLQAHVITFRRGQVTRRDVYSGWDEALEHLADPKSAEARPPPE